MAATNMFFDRLPPILIRFQSQLEINLLMNIRSLGVRYRIQAANAPEGSDCSAKFVNPF